MPSKNVIHSAKVADLVRHAGEYGTRDRSRRRQNGRRAERKRRMGEGMIAIHEKCFATDGLEFVLGEGRFVALRTIEVRLTAGGTRRLTGERIFLDLGTHAGVPDIPVWPPRRPLLANSGQDVFGQTRTAFATSELACTGATAPRTTQDRPEAYVNALRRAVAYVSRRS